MKYPNKNIVLVGFMGTGKTSIGKLLAKKLNFKYVSTDGLIVEKEGREINDIFLRDGEAYFRTIEKKVVKDVSAKDGVVIDTGGGVVLNGENIKNLKRKGTVICLWSDAETILNRTKGFGHRPLLNCKDPLRKINKLLKARQPFYRKADVHIDAGNGDPDVVARRICAIVKNIRVREKAIAGEKSNIAKLFDKLLNHAMMPVFIADKNGTIKYHNRAFLDAVGERMNGKNWITEIVKRSHHAKAYEILDSISESGSLHDIRFFELSRRKDRCISKWISCGIVTPGGRKGMIFVADEHKQGEHDYLSLGASASEIVMTNMIFSGESRTDLFTASHSSGVTKYALSLGKRMGLDKNELRVLTMAALLHDIGKLAVDEKITFKRGALNVNEYRQMKNHPLFGVELLRPFVYLWEALPIILFHHESFDGTGYPYGIKGTDIPLGARILSVADVYEALTADRPYRSAFSKKEALKIMKKGRGEKLDPAITNEFIKMIK
ncbi:MAG TPA: shikimate kinase [Candidatus Omnitrophota bacterium]|nr:shikimate kinase [Candidatus Omnitrophota bacterium]HPS19827.1 shikimate kinase [Candidatus Omnitrophota bacterium]